MEAQPEPVVLVLDGDGRVALERGEDVRRFESVAALQERMEVTVGRVVFLDEERSK